ncbi:hypothetical protein SCA6_020428 [Theobroma cacao]
MASQLQITNLASAIVQENMNKPGGTLPISHEIINSVATKYLAGSRATYQEQLGLKPNNIVLGSQHRLRNSPICLNPWHPPQISPTLHSFPC